MYSIWEKSGEEYFLFLAGNRIGETFMPICSIWSLLWCFRLSYSHDETLKVSSLTEYEKEVTAYVTEMPQAAQNMFLNTGTYMGLCGKGLVAGGLTGVASVRSC